MRFYRVENYNDHDSSLGFEWFVNRKAAEAAAAALGTQRDVEVVEITPTKAGILKALESYAAHPDNG